MTTFEAEIEIVDDGFFHPRESGRGAFVDGNRFRHVGVDDLSAAAQFVRTTVRVSPSEPPHHHIVIWAHCPRVDDDFVAQTDSALRAAFSAASVSFVRDVELSRSGDVYHADVHAWTSESRTSLESVSAICAAQCFGTLADLERLTVRLGDTMYSAQMRHGPDAWLAAVSRSSPTGE